MTMPQQPPQASVFRKLPVVEKVAALDSSGRNPGNWTVTFDIGDLAIKVFEIEVYRFLVVAGPVGSLFHTYIGNNIWGPAMQGSSNGWSEPPALPLRDGQTLYLFWNQPTSATPTPTVLIWPRYDVQLPGNQYPGQAR